MSKNKKDSKGLVDDIEDLLHKHSNEDTADLFEEIMNSKLVRDPTKEDIAITRYAIMLFLRVYIDNPPKQGYEGMEGKINSILEFLKILFSQITVLPDSELESLTKKVIGCVVFENIMEKESKDEESEEEKPQNIH